MAADLQIEALGNFRQVVKVLHLTPMQVLDVPARNPQFRCCGNADKEQSDEDDAQGVKDRPGLRALSPLIDSVLRWCRYSREFKRWLESPGTYKPMSCSYRGRCGQHSRLLLPAHGDAVPLHSPERRAVSRTWCTAHQTPPFTKRSLMEGSTPFPRTVWCSVVSGPLVPHVEEQHVRFDAWAVSDGFYRTPADISKKLHDGSRRCSQSEGRAPAAARRRSAPPKTASSSRHPPALLTGVRHFASLRDAPRPVRTIT